ncbi:MAG TPA: ribosomal protein L7/L12 [Burkholderiales bacterium]|nr:ribosomal protein L7/L12 [Burkholderiales bacterium]
MEREAVGPALSAAALSALQRGNKIEAIKLVRQERGIGLKEAKDRVEAYLQAHPSLQTGLAAAQAQSYRRALWWLAAFIAGAVLVYVLLHRP